MKDIIKQLRQRYCSLDGGSLMLLIEQMFEALDENVDNWPVDKTNRWVGFIQGMLFAKGLIDIDEEREFTRPLYHKYYEDNEIEIPTSIDVK